MFIGFYGLQPRHLMQVKTGTKSKIERKWVRVYVLRDWCDWFVSVLPKWKEDIPNSNIFKALPCLSVNIQLSVRRALLVCEIPFR